MNIAKWKWWMWLIAAIVILGAMSAIVQISNKEE